MRNCSDFNTYQTLCKYYTHIPENNYLQKQCKVTFGFEYILILDSSRETRSFRFSYQDRQLELPKVNTKDKIPERLVGTGQIGPLWKTVCVSDVWQIELK